MAAVFINYRGADSRSYGALLYTELSRQLGAENVFLDSESIPAGADFADQLLGHVRRAAVLLAVIGEHWLTALGRDRRRRIDEPADWIRRELAEAFTNGVRVVPVLVDGASLPAERDLPADIAPLARCQYRHLRHREATSDLARILAELTGLDPELAALARRRSGPRQQWQRHSYWPPNVFDRYRRRARIHPLLLTVLPVTLLISSVLPLRGVLQDLGVLLLTGGLPVLTDQLGRTRGKLVEPRLFALWGGKPTTQLLRWSGPTGHATQAFRHAALQRVVGPGLTLPTPDQESADPSGSDQTYEAAVAVLRTRLRDRGSLVFEENCNYGFRRNLYGLRPFGLAVTAASLLVTAVLVARGAATHPSLALLAGLVDLALLGLWLAVVNPRWVAQAAWAYAERLVDEALRAGTPAVPAPRQG
jgi:hypothetical protein